MTFDDDFIEIVFDGGSRRVFCKKNGIDWPPPKELNMYGCKFYCVRMSGITDERRQKMSHVCRGAEYKQLSQ